MVRPDGAHVDGEHVELIASPHVGEKLIAHHQGLRDRSPHAPQGLKERRGMRLQAKEAGKHEVRLELAGECLHPLTLAAANGHVAHEAHVTQRAHRAGRPKMVGHPRQQALSCIDGRDGVVDIENEKRAPDGNEVDVEESINDDVGPQVPVGRAVQRIPAFSISSKTFLRASSPSAIFLPLAS